MAYYRGFNTIGNKFGSVRTTDTELVKRDILNSFYITQGQKLMSPNYGSVLTGLAFEQLTPELEQVLVEEVKRVIGLDPRVRLTELEVALFDKGIQVAISLDYVNSNLSEDLYIRFNNESRDIEILDQNLEVL